MVLFLFFSYIFCIFYLDNEYKTGNFAMSNNKNVAKTQQKQLKNN